MPKTEFMLIGSGQRLNILAASPSVTMNGTRVKQVATSKSLGVTIDDKLQLPQRKTDQKDRFWNRGYETC